MDDVVACFTIMHCCDTIHDVLHPRTFPPFRFWGVTGDDSDDDFVLQTLLSMARDRLRQRGESSNDEKKRRILINRDRIATHELLVHDYFGPDSLYDLSKLEERFRISRNLFLRIARDLENNYEFFQLRWDARGRRGFSTIQKCTATLRQLAYDIAVGALDEYLKMSERTFSRMCISFL
uniref:Uncharacterized protein n=1 Tax=Lactuca sativa TaxID=4236 RepID=A0A9R1WE15_LACSA|nr:hypothetical protein LSAT_V11C200099480 [Lactuca sativa]